MTATILAALLPLLLPSAPNASSSADWSHWRGPHGNGMADGESPGPFTPADVKWKLPIPGRACATPVTYGDKMFLLTAVQLEEDVPSEPEPEPEEGGRRRRRKPGGALVEHAFDVICIDKNTGKELWRQTAVETTPHEGYHRTYGSFASSSPYTDGEHLYVFFGSRGMYCYTLDGKLVWEKDLGVELVMRNTFGEGVTPVVHGDAVVLNCDQEEQSFIVALNRHTGEELWRRDRDELSTWAPPLITQVGERTEVITSGDNFVRSYDLKNGELIWKCDGLGTNSIPTPLRYEDSVIVMSGHRNTAVMRVELGHEGDLTGTDAVLWRSEKGTAYTPSPVMHDGRLYNVTDRGFISCFDVETGEPHYLEQRMPRGLNFKSSPIGIGDELWVQAESGEVVILAMGDELEVKATIDSREDEIFMSGPIYVDGRLYLRSYKHLYCIEPGSGAGKE